jgi:hypothetical protein
VTTVANENKNKGRDYKKCRERRAITGLMENEIIGRSGRTMLIPIVLVVTPLQICRPSAQAPSSDLPQVEDPNISHIPFVPHIMGTTICL